MQKSNLEVRSRKKLLPPLGWRQREETRLPGALDVSWNHGRLSGRRWNQVKMELLPETPGKGEKEGEKVKQQKVDRC